MKMSNLSTIRLIEALSPEQLAEALLENGYPQCRQLIIDKAIDGKKFLGLTELEIKRFQMYLHQSDARRFWSFVQRIKEHPEEFTLKSSKPPQPTKPSRPRKPNKPNQQIFSIETSLMKKINEVSKKVRESSDEETWQNDWSEDEKEMKPKPVMVSKRSFEGNGETKLAFEKNRERIQQLFKGRFEEAKVQEAPAPPVKSTEPIYVNVERQEMPPLPPQRPKRNASASRRSNVEDEFPPPPSPMSSDDEAAVVPPLPPLTSTIPSLRNLLKAPPPTKPKDVSLLSGRTEVTPPPPPVNTVIPPTINRPPPVNTNMPPTISRPPPVARQNRLPHRRITPPPLSPSTFKTTTPPSPPPVPKNARRLSRDEATPPPIPPLPTNKSTSLPGTPMNRSPLPQRSTPPPPLPPSNFTPPPTPRNLRKLSPGNSNSSALPLPPKLPPIVKPDFPSLPPRPPRRDDSPDGYDEPLETPPRPPPKIKYDPEDQYEPPPTIFPNAGGLEPPAIPGRLSPRPHSNDDEDPEGYLRADNFRSSKESIGSNQDRPLPPIPPLQSASSELERNIYYRNVKRIEGEKLLEYQMLGAFVLRPSNRYYATMVVKGKHKTCNVPLVHEGSQYYLLMDVNFAKDTIKFNKLDDLITHYTRHPIPLKENSLCLMRSHNLRQGSKRGGWHPTRHRLHLHRRRVLSRPFPTYPQQSRHLPPLTGRALTDRRAKPSNNRSHSKSRVILPPLGGRGSPPPNKKNSLFFRDVPHEPRPQRPGTRRQNGSCESTTCT